jgi:hypothetical protein
MSEPLVGQIVPSLEDRLVPSSSWIETQNNLGPLARMGFRGALHGVVVASASSVLRHQQGSRTVKIDDGDVQVIDEVHTFTSYSPSAIFVGTDAFRLWIPSVMVWDEATRDEILVMLIRASTADTGKIWYSDPYPDFRQRWVTGMPST